MNKFPAVRSKNYNIYSNSYNSLKIRRLKFKFLHYRTKSISLDYKSECKSDDILYHWAYYNIIRFNSLINYSKNKKNKLFNANLLSLNNRILTNKLSLENGSLEIINE